MELISVVIPVYNTGKYLEKCINSILEQTYKNIEVILVDDGSDDIITKEICNNYVNKYSNIKLIKQKNSGTSAARNTGILHSKGQFIGFIDSDDYISHNMYENLYNAMRQYETEVAFCDMQLENYNRKNKIDHVQIRSGRYTKSDSLKYLLLGNWHSVCTALYSKKVIKDKTFLEGRINEDYIFQFEILKEVENIAYINEATYFYVKRDSSNTGAFVNKKTLQWLEHTEQIMNYINKNEEYKFLKEEGIYQFLFSYIVLCNKIILNNFSEYNEYRYNLYLELSKEMRMHLKYIISNKYLSVSKKIMGIMICLAPRFYINTCLKILKYRSIKKRN